MINPSLIRYPIDTTGIHPDNKIVNERHEVTPTMRTIIPRQGYFYGESLVIIRADRPLVLGVDYQVDDMNDDLTHKTGKAVMHSIIITDETIVGELSLTYQCYGSGDNFTRTHIAELVHQANTRQDLHYKNIIGLPSRFLPEPHRHPVQDTYGWRATVYLFDEMVRLLSHWRLDRDGTLYTTMARFQDDVNRIIQGFQRDLTNARDTMGSVNDLDAKVDAAIAKIQSEVAAMSSLEDMQRLLNELKRELTNAYKAADTTLEGKVTNAYTSADSALGRRIDALTTTVNGLASSTELNNRFNQYLPLTTYNRDKNTFALKTDITRIDGVLNQKPTTAEMNTAIANATRTVPWNKLTSVPRLWIDHQSNSSKNFNDYKTMGSYVVTAMTNNVPNNISNDKNGMLFVYESPTQVMQVFKERNGTSWYRTGTKNGALISRWENWVCDNMKGVTALGAQTNFETLFKTQQNGFYDVRGTLNVLPSFPTNKHGKNGVPSSSENSDWIVINIDGHGQHTFIASAGAKNHFIFTDDKNTANDKVVERFITDKLLEDNYPRIWNVATELDEIKRSIGDVRNLANNTSGITNALDGLRTEVRRDYVPLNRVQTGIYDHGVNKLPKYDHEGKLSATKLIVGTASSTAKTFWFDGGSIYLNALFKPENIQLTSDANLKKDIVPIENPEDIICGISGYKYRFKKDNREAVGVIAQEVELVLPEAVSKDREGTRSVDYNAIVAVLVETVKSQQLTIDILKSRIERLEKSMVE